MDLKSERGRRKVDLYFAREGHQQDRTVPLQGRRTDEAAELEQLCDYKTHQWVTKVNHPGFAKVYGNDHIGLGLLLLQVRA